MAEKVTVPAAYSNAEITELQQEYGLGLAIYDRISPANRPIM
jgi:hypothetical protein